MWKSLNWVVISSEKNWRLQLDVSISMLCMVGLAVRIVTDIQGLGSSSVVGVRQLIKVTVSDK